MYRRDHGKEKGEGKGEGKVLCVGRGSALVHHTLTFGWLAAAAGMAARDVNGTADLVPDNNKKELITTKLSTFVRLGVLPRLPAAHRATYYAPSAGV